jgi:hypothetical protein
VTDVFLRIYISNESKSSEHAKSQESQKHGKALYKRDKLFKK